MNLEKWMLDKYGPTMTLDQLSECIHIEPSTMLNQIGAGRFQFHSWKEGRQRLVATEEVAQYIESKKLKRAS